MHVLRSCNKCGKGKQALTAHACRRGAVAVTTHMQRQPSALDAAREVVIPSGVRPGVESCALHRK